MKDNITGFPLKKRLAHTLRGCRILLKYCPGLLQAIIALAIVTSLQPFVTIWFSARILNEISGNFNVKLVITYAIIAILIKFLLSLLKNWLDAVHNERESQMWCYFERIFADKQLMMDFVDVENASVQQRKNKEKENLYMFGNGLGQLVWSTSGLVEAIVSIIASVTMTVTLFTANSGKVIIDSPLWIIPIFIVVIVGGIANSKAFVKENEVFIEWSKKTVWFNRIFQFYGWTLYSTLERAKDVRMYHQSIQADRMLKKMQENNKAASHYALQMSIYEAIANVIIGISYVICYLFVVLKAFYGAFGVGSIVQYVGALSRLGDGIQKLLFSWADNMVYTQHLDSLFEFLDIPNKKYEGTLPVEKRDDDEYELEFQDVSFMYPNTKKYALKNFSLKFKLGERLAVVGRNGSGKTTFIKLLCRLYDPDEGEILLNGINIKKYNYDEYLALFSVVFQDFSLFSFTLGQNVATDMEIDKSKVEAVLKRVGFKERYNSLPNKTDTCLYKDFEENGVEISGGEAQKIALARALYKDAPFAILDEPTAALDPIAECEIYSHFDETVGTKTAVYISHRLASCRFCDEVIVLDEGRLKQKGTHEELVSDVRGLYYQLWKAQAQYYMK